MVNILVPTDLSELSKVATLFAIKVANKLEGNVTLLHVITIVQPTRATMRLRVKALEKELIAAAQEDIDKLVKDVSKSLKRADTLKVKVVLGGSFNDTVKREAKKLRTGLIVMGTRGASGLKKYVLGSNTASVLEVSHVPVLVVPELAEFKNFKTVVYATDMKHTEKELKTLIPYLEKFDTTVHLIHIASSAKNVSAIEKKIDTIVQKAGYKNVVVRVMVNQEVDKAIDNYVSTIKADLLAMFTHEHSFYDKLFDRSITRKAAFQSKIPLLAFKGR
jgi:nucleotide-binding universal stress UspA family protein